VSRFEHALERGRREIDAFGRDARLGAPEVIAAIANTCVVLLLPVVFAAFLSVTTADPRRTTVTAASPLWRVFENLAQIAIVLEVTFPLAVVAGWRTWVHARRYRAGIGTGWQGVGEGALMGLMVALIVLAPGISLHPLQAPPNIMFYGGGAAIIGAAVGLGLRACALLVLRFKHAQRASQ
jgi:hypothetical protein